MYVCVREREIGREGEGERDRESKRDRKRKRESTYSFGLSNINIIKQHCFFFFN